MPAPARGSIAQEKAQRAADPTSRKPLKAKVHRAAQAKKVTVDAADLPTNRPHAEQALTVGRKLGVRAVARAEQSNRRRSAGRATPGRDPIKDILADILKMASRPFIQISQLELRVKIEELMTLYDRRCADRRNK
jgi:hypothetical protein